MFALVCIENKKKRLFSRDYTITQEKYYLKITSNSRKTHRAFRAATKLGACGFVVPKDFVMPESRNIYPVFTPTSLYRTMAADILFFRARKLGLDEKNLRVEVCASHWSSELENAVHKIAFRVKSLKLYAGEDTEIACRAFRRQTGISLLQSGKSDITLLFNKFEDKEGICLCKTGKIKLSVPRKFALPEDCDQESLIAALYSEGFVRLDQICIEDVQNK